MDVRPHGLKGRSMPQSCGHQRLGGRRVLAIVIRRLAAVAWIGMLAMPSMLRAEDSASGYFQDPATGIVYRKVRKTVERPVVESRTEPRETTTYRPETVVEVRPETRTIYTPVVRYNWQPRLRGRWNPFRQPSLHYEHVPTTHWEARTETIERRQQRTNWVAEKQRQDVTVQTVRIQREEREELEAVGRVPLDPKAGGQSAEIAARLKPIESPRQLSPVNPTTPAASVASLPNFRHRTRRPEQAGMQATQLTPQPVYPGSLPMPAGGNTGVAGGPILPLWR